jgi:SulP family sulfate permease
LVLLTVIFLTPLFYYLPNAVLGAIILVAVANLIDIAAFKHIWAYNKGDVAALIVTFIAVLLLGIEQGILVGAGVALAIFIWRTSRPHMATVGRIGKSEMYRNVLRYDVETWPEVLVIRMDESLYFANTKYLEDTVLAAVADQPEVKHFILQGNAINFIDASALETLESLREELHSAGVEMHLTEIKGPVLDRLRAIGFVDKIGPNRIHFSTNDALIALGYVDPSDIDDINAEEAARRAQKPYPPQKVGEERHLVK